ncbi:Permease of the drug/metabolite transporter (DMT) superfamily [Lachnospiraceae bacterium XBD2001]|nr:Permease of the drug/metabolite transporter (DMT) superfamily [Lachnospiraceae bacterium XBD2001]
MHKKELLKNRGIVLLLAVLCCLLWGSAFPVIKIGYRILGIASANATSQILFAGVRFFLAGILAILLGSILQKKFLFPAKSSWGMIGTLSLFQTVLQYLFFYLGLAHASGVNASIINGVNTFFAILLATLARKQERLTSGKLLGCILGTAGVVFVSISGGNVGGGFALNGEGFIVIASMSYAVSSVLMKEYALRENPVTLSGYQFLVGGAVMMLIGGIAGGNLGSISAQGLLLILYLALVSSVAYSIWSVLLKYNPVSSVAIYGFTTPIFGAMLSAILLGEWSSVTIRHVIALALVSIGIYIVNRK